MFLWGEILKLKKVDYVPILMCLMEDNNNIKEKNNNIVKIPKKHINNKEMRKLEKECGLLW